MLWRAAGLAGTAWHLSFSCVLFKHNHTYVAIAILQQFDYAYAMVHDSFN